MGISEIFSGKARTLFWRRLNPDHVVDCQTGVAIETDQAYFVIRMKEMYLATTRRLWRRFYPMLHGYVDYAGSQVHSVAGPGQLRELTDANLDRIVNLNLRLAGPIAYKGGEVSILIGLYSVPGQDAARALVDTVCTVANLAGIAAGQAAPIATAIKSGVENILGLNDARLELGIRDSFYQNNRLQSCYYVGINVPSTDVAFNELWVRDGRLIKGPDPIVGVNYEDHDYMIIEIERRDSRDDWPSLPGISQYQERFADVMRDETLNIQQKRQKLFTVWPAFKQSLDESPYLTQPDREQIAGSVGSDLKKRLEAMEKGNPFESRGWRDEHVVLKSPAQFDFLDVPNYIDRNDAASARMAKLFLEVNPFTI